MSEGMIVGGWSYVIAAYAITAVGLVGYFWSLRRRQHHLDNED
ncbi:MAG: CcmD family protein [Thermoanaerobaculia bacterium]